MKRVILIMADVFLLLALTVESGVQWYEAYAAASSYNRTIVGGLSPNASIGSAGGWVAGGGHSILSPTYGLGKSKNRPPGLTSNVDHRC
jgi:FAD binding domain